MLYRSLRRAAGSTLAKIPSQQASKGDRVVVLGSGWGGFQLVRTLVTTCLVEHDSNHDDSPCCFFSIHNSLGAGFEYEQGRSSDLH
jgi:hypothetical protein